MIVQPDFLEHWKTRYLVDLLDDPCAPLYVIRLWGHCQMSKTHGFSRKSPSVLKAICKAPHDAEIFESAIIEAGFVDLVDDMWVVHEWDCVNAYLVANWKNGTRGGRPRKTTQLKPMGLQDENPPKTHRKPIREDKRREEKREEDIPSESHPPAGDGSRENEELVLIPPEPEDSEEMPSAKNGAGKKGGGKWTKPKIDAARYEDFPGFLKWWKAYPRTDGKRAAFEAWLKRGLEQDTPGMLSALSKKKKCRQWLDENGKYIPHGSTYLNSRMDEDEPENDFDGVGASENVKRFRHG